MDLLKRFFFENLHRRVLLIAGPALLATVLLLTTIFFLQVKKTLHNEFTHRASGVTAILARDVWQTMAGPEPEAARDALAARANQLCRDADVRFMMVMASDGSIIASASAVGFSLPQGFAETPSVEQAPGAGEEEAIFHYRVPICEEHQPRVAPEGGDSISEHSRCEHLATVLVGVSTARTLGEVSKAFWTSLIVGSILVVLGLCGILLLTHIALRPISRMAAAVRKVSQGDLSERAEITSDDEIGDLAKAFNEMTWSLADSQEEVAKRNEELQMVATEKERLYQNARERATRLEVMNELAKAIAATMDPNEIFQNVHEQLTRLMQFEYFTIQRLVPERQTFRREYVWVDEGAAGDIKVGQEVEVGKSPIHQVMETKMPLSIPDFEKDEALSNGWLSKGGFKSGFIVPIVAQEEFLGSIGLAWRHKNGFARLEVATVFAIADTLAVVLKNAELYKRLEASYMEVRDAHERLARSEHVRRAEKLRSVGQMTSGIAHNFNNVMSAIIGRVQLIKLKAMRYDVAQEEVLDSLTVIEQAALDGAETVRRLQDFSRGGQKGEGKGEKGDLNDIIRSVIEITRPRWKDQAEQTGQHINVKTQLESLPAVSCNPSEIREVLTNLIFNAVDAMPQGGLLIIGSRREEDRAVITVKDSGEGMPEDVRERIFDPFYTTKGVKGSGLGLSTVYGIVERHQGEISVTSASGEGTEFEIQLPLAQEKTRKRHREDVPESRPWRILIGDDEQNVREALADLLRVLGHEVTLAHSGEATVDAFSENPDFDLVFTDLGMPDMSGWEVTEAIRETGSDVPIVLATGWGAQIEEADAKARGVTRVLSKPFTVQKVASLVAEIQGLDKAA